jgi:hypothetical protein
MSFKKLSEDISNFLKVLGHLGTDEEKWLWQTVVGSNSTIVSLLYTLMAVCIM